MYTQNVRNTYNSKMPKIHKNVHRAVHIKRKGKFEKEICITIYLKLT